MVIDLPQIFVPYQVFEECVVNKQHWSQFPSKKIMESKEYFGVGAFGLMWPNKTLSDEGNKYLITFTDAFSRKIRVYFFTGKVIRLLCI